MKHVCKSCQINTIPDKYLPCSATEIKKNDGKDQPLGKRIILAFADIWTKNIEFTDMIQLSVFIE